MLLFHMSGSFNLKSELLDGFAVWNTPACYLFREEVLCLLGDHHPLILFVLELLLQHEKSEEGQIDTAKVDVVGRDIDVFDDCEHI